MTLRNLFLVPLFIVIVVTAGCFSDELGGSYATRAEAAGAIERGWIPDVLPVSAVDIHESHSLDTNVGRGTFVFDATDLQSFQAALSPIPSGQSDRCGTRKELEASGYVFYSYKEFDIAVNWPEHKGQFCLGPAQ